MTRLVPSSFLFGLLALFSCCGCEPAGPKHYPVSGTVSLDGQPLAEGIVHFKVVEAGTIVSLPALDGKFEGAVTAGRHRVEVVAYQMIPVPGEMGGEVPKSLIAPRFNSASTLSAEVTPAGPNVFDFKVESK